MRTKAVFSEQLILKQILLLPGGEWTPRLPGWSIIRVSRGVGYFLDPRLTYELTCGSVLILSDLMRGAIRSSQLCEMVLHYFCVQPENLSGILTMDDQKVLGAARAKEPETIRLLAADGPLADYFQELCESQHDCPARVRLQLLDLFLRAFESQLRLNPQSINHQAARARLENILKQMSAAEMSELSFAELAAKIGCSPRHLGRIFREVVGVSFRAKQAQIRLGKAQELLASTESKVVEVALASGYQSLSLFNLMFKRKFGVTPGQWRQREAKQNTS